MKLGVINSFLVVCFTMVQKIYIFRSEKFLQNFLQKHHIMAINKHLGENVLHLQYIQEKILQ